MIKVVIEASRADKDFREVFFYDNDEMFTMRRSFGLKEGENDFYGRWTPKEPGERTLKVVIMEDEDDPEPGNNSISLDVNVLDFHSQPQSSGGGGGCFIRTAIK